MGEVTANIVNSQPQGQQGVVIRNAKYEDAEFLGRLVAETFREKYEHAVGKKNFEALVRATADINRDNQSLYHRQFIAVCDGERTGVMVLKYKGDPKPNDDYGSHLDGIGCCAFVRLWCLDYILGEHTPKRRECYIDHICVDETFRGRGIGKALMEHAVVDARKNGCTQLTLYVAENNRARQLYERLGYRLIAENECACLNKFASGQSSFIQMGLEVSRGQCLMEL